MFEGKKPFESIVLSGGGIRGFYLLGALNYFYSVDGSKPEYFNHETIREYRGTSVGSVICTLMSIGYSPSEIFDQILDNDVLKPTSTHHILEMMCKKSLMSITHLIKFIGELMEDKGFYSQVTFEEHYNHTGKDLFITGTNFSSKGNKAVIFSRYTTPNMSILKANEISCSVFPIFPLVLYQGNLYGDGGFTCNFPLDCDSHLKILGVYLYSDSVIDQDSGIMEVFSQAVMTPVAELTNFIIKHKPKDCVIIPVCAGDISAITYVKTQEEKIKMYKEGGLAAMEKSENNKY